MRDSTLNLIAISIFSFTMLSLLGPMLSLSPAVPAVAAAGLLGLATLDQLGLEGRMGNLVVDWFAWTSPEYRQRVLRHEAGHFLVASLLDIPVVGYTLNTWEAWKQGLPGQGGVVFDTAALEQTFAEGQIPVTMVDRYCRVWMAGIAAEQIAYGDALGGVDDRQKFAQLWQQMDRPAAEAQLKQRWAVLQAKTLLQNNQTAFEQLVEAMDQRQPVAVCQQIVQQHRAGAAAA
ncbi:MAG: ATP-dependent Zn protease [Cyanobacteria bacterium Co-bin13]|nr:ATP-dependent Zn protease [Cyanobacteria bacterium Co-bin13]